MKEQSEWLPDSFSKACRFAAEAHQGQTMQETDLPYLLHLSLVSQEVLVALAADKSYDANLAVQCAWLHDTLEDTAVTYEQLQQHFGTPVADGVLALSKDETLAKSEQMADSLSRIRQQPQEIWLIKLADRISNLQPPPSSWSAEKITRYQAETRLIYDALQEANALLAGRLLAKAEAYRAFL
jgi:(p)ppGpp synthase/HD superfamily hydrolase